MIRDLNNDQIRAILYEAQQKIELLTGRSVRVGAEFNLPLQHVSPDVILEEVSKRTGIDVEHIKSSQRTEELVDIRHCIMYFLRRRTDWEDAKIADVVNRERTAANYGEKTIADLLKTGNERFMQRFHKVYTAIRTIAEQEAAYT